MRKKSTSGVLARHCRLSVSAAFTNVTRVIPRVVNLSGSPYGHETRACLGRLGVGGYEVQFTPSLAAVLPDGLLRILRVLVKSTRRMSGS